MKRARRAFAGAALLGLALLAAPAYAYLTGTGGGTGAAATGTLQPLVVLAATTGAPGSNLQPGATADLLLEVQNPNPTAVTIVRVAQAGGVTVVGGSGCTSDPGWPATTGNSGVSVATTSASVVVPAGATVPVQVSGAAVMSTASASGCQGASFHVPVTVDISQ